MSAQVYIDSQNNVLTHNGSPLTTPQQEKYALLSRVKDDSNNDIGCVVGFHKDSSNNKYAVVCLNKQYRNTSGYAWLSAQESVTDLPEYNNASVYEAKETATFTCDKILAYATANNLQCTAVTQCRSFSFVIGGITYYGQLPTLTEMICIFENLTYINNNDPSSSGDALQVGANYIQSTPKDSKFIWRFSSGSISSLNKTYTNSKIIPILEIPIN